MFFEIIKGCLIPFFGTALGAACVFFIKGGLGNRAQSAFAAFAAGVMAAASVWSLIIPAIDASAYMGKLSFLPCVVGFFIGIFFLLICDALDASIRRASGKARDKNGMLLLAVTIHNVPEGMAVGAVFAALMQGSVGISLLEAMALSIGIAVQNFPEGAIVSMPIRASGAGRWKAFAYGSLSGAVEPAAAFLTVLLSDILVPIIPYLLGFAAGAMIYAVAVELIPEMWEGDIPKSWVIFFALGFALMMSLDVTLG